MRSNVPSNDSPRYVKVTKRIIEVYPDHLLFKKNYLLTQQTLGQNGQRNRKLKDTKMHVKFRNYRSIELEKRLTHCKEVQLPFANKIEIYFNLLFGDI